MGIEIAEVCDTTILITWSYQMSFPLKQTARKVVIDEDFCKLLLHKLSNRPLDYVINCSLTFHFWNLHKLGKLRAVLFRLGNKRAYNASNSEA